MDWTSIIEKAVVLLTSGGVLYLIVEKLFERRKHKEDVKHQQVENVKETIEYGIPMITIYDEIRKIVVKETTPIQEKLDKALLRIDDLESNYCCYRNKCDFRIRNRADAEALTPEDEIKSIAHESIKHSCKD